ncbi:MAG TPA: bifunctional UDP-N-acetylglucosamine diphosphorylase/glucosamine-1-phosphate N-acetyltransferase GlmU [Thermotogae bacterium]|nr:bifunctional UDP-N-acetylglucosamine diphosphorylase/glucosamine-1-phosphate N-acetyltransferase GlmU [Thermotogota bacterium]
MKTLILAAGLGKRMKSKKPKVLHEILRKPMILWVIDTVSKLENNAVGVVLGHRWQEVKALLPEHVEVFLQEEQLGTAHAVMCAGDFVKGDQILVTYGDVPLVKSETLKNLLALHRNSKAQVTLITVEMDDPTGYGRIVRDGSGNILGIVEETDTDERTRKIREINTGIAIYDGDFLYEALKKISPENAQGEYYLTDVVSFADKGRVVALKLEDRDQVRGVNDRVQLAELERIAKERILRDWMLFGVSVEDPATVYIGPDVVIGRDTIIRPMTMIYGKTMVGEDCEVGPFAYIQDCIVSDRVKIVRSECWGAHIESGAVIGPFARLREGSFICEDARIGNFVEVKKSKVGRGSKAQHLTYIGDATIGENVNIGAGTITCNYDGFKKHPTFIEDGAFIGSNTALVAPVTVGKGAIVAAGSVITEDVPDNALAIARGRQVNKPDWAEHFRRERGMSHGAE